MRLSFKRISGHPVEASKLLNRIVSTYLTDTGDLRDSPDQKTSGTYTSHFAQVYPNGWIALGAYWLNRLDTFSTLLNGLIVNYYDENMGGFRSTCDPSMGEFDITSAAMAVEILLLADIEKAKKAGDFVISFIDAQPDIDNYFYSRMDKSKNCIIESNPKSEVYSHIQIGKNGQALWFIGMPIAALTILYEATGEQKYLDGAVKFYNIYKSCGDTIYQATSSGKAFWGCAMLYRLTREKKYLEDVQKFAEFFFSLQEDAGYFLVPGLPKEEGMKLKLLFDATPEYGRWFLEVAAEISGIDV